VTIVSQNLLHGIACAEDSDRCDLPARVELFVQQLADSGCPQLVSVQEANQQTVDLLRSTSAAVCDGAYEVVWDDDPGVDREVVLTTEPVLGSRRLRLSGPLRSALWVRVATRVGVVDYVSSHLASGSDDRPCDAATCPSPCLADDMLNTCQGRQVVEWASEVAYHDPNSPRSCDGPCSDSVLVIGGDLNAQPGEPTIEAITDAGFLDTHLAAGNPECDPATGAQCTSGRLDDALTDLTDPASTQSERIDYLFVSNSRNCTAIAPTGLFNGEPAEGELAFPADHTGVQATLLCPTTADEVADAVDATVPDVAPTTTKPGTTGDAATVEAITAAYTNLFDGSVTDIEVKLASLESADVLEPFFLESYEATKPISTRISIRIDAIAVTDATHADVTYTLLLDGAAVIDHFPGTAVSIDDTWLVSLRTYCDVSTQGSDTIPAPCQ
jgi:endonuclease/exonuclease/phosphatase family metal-dependent hydrolase